MKTLQESIIGKKGNTRHSRPMWYKNHKKESKPSKDEIEGDIEDCLGNVRDNNNYLRGMYDSEAMYVNYVADVLNIAALCKDKIISDLAIKYLTAASDEDLFNGVVSIAHHLGLIDI